MPKLSIQMVVFDWAGTIIDYGCQAPTGAFVTAFAKRGVTVTAAEAREPMGLHKKDHIRAMLQNLGVAQKWRSVVGNKWTEDDVEELYKLVTPLQVAAVKRYGLLIPEVRRVATTLRRRAVKIATTTGYFREAAEACYTTARQQGFEPDFTICADEVPAGRPAPWMIFRAMEKLNVYPPAAVIKVGDTVADVEEGCNAGVWSVAVTDTGNEAGLSHADFSQLSHFERRAIRTAAKTKFLEAGAHVVLRSIAEVPDLVARINRKLAAPNARREPSSGR